MRSRDALVAALLSAFACACAQGQTTVPPAPVPEAAAVNYGTVFALALAAVVLGNLFVLGLWLLACAPGKRRNDETLETGRAFGHNEGGPTRPAGLGAPGPGAPAYFNGSRVEIVSPLGT